MDQVLFKAINVVALYSSDFKGASSAASLAALVCHAGMQVPGVGAGIEGQAEGWKRRTQMDHVVTTLSLALG